MMRRRISWSVAVGLGFSLAWAATAAAADDEGTPLAGVHVNDLKTFPNLPVGAPRGVCYGFPQGHGHGHGCGLLLRGSKTIIPLLEPGDDGEWPSCMCIPEATTFDWHGRPVYVYRYLQRDTRQDTYAYDAFVRIGRDGIEGVAGLVLDDQPRSLSIGRAAAWAKSSLAAVRLTKDGFVQSKRDTVLADRSYLIVARHAGSGLCRIDVDRLAAGGTLAQVTTPCKTILATTSLATPQSDWLVVMTQGPDGQPRAHVFEAGAAGVRRATDVETKLASTVAGGKVPAVKTALKRLLGK